jgi:hypothetical protein
MVFALRRFFPPPLVACGTAILICAVTARAEESPFVQAGGRAGANKAGSAAAFELAGASVTAEGTQVCVFDAQAKRSRWIAVGATVDRIQVVSYDAQADRAVIRVDGVQQELSLRKATVTSLTPGPGWQNPTPSASGAMIMPAPAMGAPPTPTPKSPKMLKEEEEARMLVSDLMDISIRQRKAYEEAQKKAAQTAPNPKP